MGSQSVRLDNRIFALQNAAGLPEPLGKLLHAADVAFLQGDESQAEALVSIIEAECTAMGVRVMPPTIGGVTLPE